MTALANPLKRWHIVLRCTKCGPLGLLFPVRWEWGRVLAIGKIAQFWYSLGKFKRKWNWRNLHLMSILFRILLTTTLFLILSYEIWALHIKCLYFKVFTLTVCSTMVIFGHLLGKKVLFGIGTGSLKRTQIHYKKSLASRCSGSWELESVSANQKPVRSSLYTEQHEKHTIDFEYFFEIQATVG